MRNPEDDDEDRSQELTQGEDWLVNAMYKAREWRKARRYAKRKYGVELPLLPPGCED